MREPPVAGAALRPLAEAPGGELFQCRLFLRQLPLNRLRHRQNGCRSVEATVLGCEIQTLHDKFRVLLAQGDGVTHWARPPAVVEQPTMPALQESPR